MGIDLELIVGNEAAAHFLVEVPLILVAGSPRPGGATWCCIKTVSCLTVRSGAKQPLESGITSLQAREPLFPRSASGCTSMTWRLASVHSALGPRQLAIEDPHGLLKE